MKFCIAGILLILLHCAQTKQKYKPEEADETARLNVILPGNFQVGKNYCHDSGRDFKIGFVRAYDEDNNNIKDAWYSRLIICRLSDSEWKMFYIMVKRPTNPDFNHLKKLTYYDDGKLSHIKVGDCSIWFSPYGSSMGPQFDEPYNWTSSRKKAFNEVYLYLSEKLEKSDFCEKMN